MNCQDLQWLPQALNKKVKVTSTEGEQFISRVAWVDLEKGELIHDLISTSVPERYMRMGKSEVQGAYLIPFSYIESIELCESE